MSDTVIRVENLSKEYRLGIISHQTLSKDLQSWWARMRGKEDPNARLDFNQASNSKAAEQDSDRFWALQDISFDVKQGEILGIIGKNGAGKSTLLKILSKVTTPTKGQIKIKGRIASLLEVGTGFHPELTGRENIFLNGAILGMDKGEIRGKFDEIVAFSEVEKFIDTPVKRYSSGMYVRLAFAVAAHLEPEILIVDEVLAVGDLEFQKKCLGKMGEVAREGRTVLFVSHNMSAIRNLCHTCLMLKNGRLIDSGPAAQIVDKYEQNVLHCVENRWLNPAVEDRQNDAYIEEISICSQNGDLRNVFKNTEEVILRFMVIVTRPVIDLKVGFDLMRRGEVVFRSQQVDSLPAGNACSPGRVNFFCRIKDGFLNAGEYQLRPLISIHCKKGLTVVEEPVLRFAVNLNADVSTYHQILHEGNHPGSVFPLLEWSLDG